MELKDPTTSLALRWSAPTDNGGVDVADYEISYYLSVVGGYGTVKAGFSENTPLIKLFLLQTSISFHNIVPRIHARSTRCLI